MTMIRINLIAEKKAASPKAAKKAAAAAGGGAQSELQENAILIAAILVAVVLVFVMRHFVKQELNEARNEKARLEAEWQKVQHWEEKQITYEIQKELLNEKIKKISDLRDAREGPVKLMEDIYNVLPESAWLVEIRQGYDGALIKPTKTKRKTRKMPGDNLGSPLEFKIEGYASSSEAVTGFTNKLADMSSRYNKIELNNWEQQSVDDVQVVKFDLYFSLKKKRKPAPAKKPGGGG